MAIKLDDLDKAVAEILETYKDDLVMDFNAAASLAGKTAVQELRRTSPRKTGAYAKSWTYKSTLYPATGFATTTVYARAPHYRLTHLLENGHAKRGGGRVSGRTHIAPVETEIITEYERAIQEVATR